MWIQKMNKNDEKHPFSLSFGKEPVSLINRNVQSYEIIDTFEAVSYTHLDVYKRQRVRRCSTASQITESSEVNILHRFAWIT